MIPSFAQLLIAGAIALILFKGRELPGLLAHGLTGLGKGLAGFRRELSDDTASTLEGPRP
jgi:Sec-independent protein translocase protein TatA